jgi:hypothetical protein
METESLSDADRIAGNADVLSNLESEIISLEQMFTGVESLKSEKDRLSAAVRTLAEEEAHILQDDSAEAVIVKRLLHTRATKDVQSARLASTQEKITEQQSALAIQGENVRKAFARVAQLWQSRDVRVAATLAELFGSDWIILRDGKRLEMRHLARHTKLIREIRDLDNRLCHPVSDPTQETAALKRARTWLIEIKGLIDGEPVGLALRVPAEQQPIEQPQELATA